MYCSVLMPHDLFVRSGWIIRSRYASLLPLYCLLSIYTWMAMDMKLLIWEGQRRASSVWAGQEKVNAFSWDEIKFINSFRFARPDGLYVELTAAPDWKRCSFVTGHLANFCLLSIWKWLTETVGLLLEVIMVINQGLVSVTHAEEIKYKNL